MVRVLHVIGSLETGGAETALARICLATRELGLDHRVLVLGPVGPLADELQTAGTPVLAPRVDLSDGVRFLRLPATWRPQVVQGWMYHGSLAASALQPVLFPGAALAWNIRCGLDTPGRYRSSTWNLIRMLAALSQVPGVILYNAVSARGAHEAAGYASGCGEVIPNGFDLEKFRPDSLARQKFRSGLGVRDGVALLGLAARFHEEKNPGLFLRALARLPGHVHGLMVGSGMVAGNPALACQIRDLGLMGRVHLLGERRDMWHVMASLDVAVSASWNEGFSNTLGEAQACGIPCVATAVGDSPALVGGLGRLVVPGDDGAMADALVDLLALSGEERVALGYRCRQRMQDMYGLPSVARRYSAVYQRLVDRL